MNTNIHSSVPSMFDNPGGATKKFTPIQQRLIELLRDGKCSAPQITNALKIGDPRSAIRDLRKKGVEVKDTKVKSSHGGFYKLYWIDKPYDYE